MGINVFFERRQTWPRQSKCNCFKSPMRVMAEWTVLQKLNIIYYYRGDNGKEETYVGEEQTLGQSFFFGLSQTNLPKSPPFFFRQISQSGDCTTTNHNPLRNPQNFGTIFLSIFLRYIIKVKTDVWLLNLHKNYYNSLSSEWKIAKHF